MQATSIFSLYNASAGSGKTFTLVKNYLKLLFTSKSLLAFKNILALTFTNKAVGEMKSRIVKTLNEFSKDSILESDHAMFKMIAEELEISPEHLHLKSKRLLELLVHNYAAFDVSTIDKFNHRLIRVFAHDLKLPVNFEVELDTDSILSQAVDQLIDKAGTNKVLTKILVDFAIEKADDDKSWDISYDFNAIAKLLTTESELQFVKQLEGKTLDDFKNLKANLKQKREISEKRIVEIAQNVLQAIANNGLEFTDFSRSTLPNHFKKAEELSLSGLYNNKLEENLIEKQSIYTAKLDKDKANSIEAMLPQLLEAYLEMKTEVHHFKFLNNALKNITPLSVLSAIGQSLQDIKSENDILLISEFNSIINSEINAQPAPFIYERMGEKFRHYFIDEFQDTSELQWENLIPLIDNAITGENLKGETGSVLLVGDAKQAIYRWRGGKAEQFINLYSGKTPFFVKPKLETLDSNFRSLKAIVNFNNSFFKHLSTFAFSNENHKTVYEASQQDFRFEKEGFVSLSFLDIDDQDKDEAYCEAVLDAIYKATEDGYSLSDISIIVRKSKEGIAIAEFLTQQQIPIISSETLVLQNSPEVQFLTNVIVLNIQPDNQEARAELLSFIADRKLNLEDKHGFLSDLVHLETHSMFKSLKEFGFEFDLNEFSQLPMYESMESVIRAFELTKTSNAYIQFYLDEVFTFSQKQNASFQGFIDYWDRKKEKLSIVAPEGKDAVQILTIHKSKGLEFPVVIFPYANQDIYFDMNPKIWFPVEQASYCGFEYLYLNMNNDLEGLGEVGAAAFQLYRSNLELDSINLLYVAFTRAAEQLYVISEMDLDRKQMENVKYYSGLLIHYLKAEHLWNPDQLQYEFGERAKPSEAKHETSNTKTAALFISTKKEDHHLSILSNSGFLWNTQQAAAIERGNLVHDIMSHIKTKADVDDTLEDYLTSGVINDLQYAQLSNDIKSIIQHKLLAPYYEAGLKVLNERDIISKNGSILRPDRIVINSNREVAIIDYKTGLLNPKHKEQLYEYQNVLEEMGYKVIKRILIYINDGIVAKEF
ncbi:AAA family ATPase [Subsaximicrobium wynnwilliamsii]|uniref:DNA 3'-5' helicase n=1 Tax=Subsaximicrobium wynnwilliamsii TaxID=291179 RepID=A0A5C6ZGT4_9FLAO|nr:UvrD-helicase domain-containing protein [Subsaximicrobium wynnwilliamsii]TXD83772.1 AAA family ATPase [Subsaximicrobium wynnwilliamsii]TXD89345.1 AAA family ATPase [Subsaximicrobium wynnwilliamsii]TXE03608.1 AAA family ATPase [Subsaximicrobium wynnwilliamsii]